MTRPITTILFYNDFWPHVPESIPDSPRPFEIFYGQNRLPEAHIVVFHIPSLELPLPTDRHSGQLWAAWSMESDVNYPLLNNPTFMAQFDLTMTYRRDVDIWTPYFGPDIVKALATPPQIKLEEAQAVYIASNFRDRSGRNTYVSELMKYIEIDSYGRCLNNRTFQFDTGRETKLQTIARYKFTLAFENSISHDYVTEKFFDPLIAGSVPIYLGAPNVDDFVPGDHCFINVADFDGPEQLAEYLLYLDEHDQEYVKYLEWKSRDLKTSFINMIEYTTTHPLCRLVSLWIQTQEQNGNNHL